MVMLLLAFQSFAQDVKNQKIEPVGDLFEVTVFYEEGQIMQVRRSDRGTRIRPAGGAILRIYV